MNAGLMSGFGNPPAAGAKPRRVTTLTGGAGVFQPYASEVWARVTVVGGGGGGGFGNGVDGGGGSASPVSIFWVRLSGTYSYSIGAGGVGAAVDGTQTAGGTTTFGPMAQPGGAAGAGMAPEAPYFGTPSTAGAVAADPVGLMGSRSIGTATGSRAGGSNAYGAGGATTNLPGRGYGSGGGRAGGPGAGGVVIVEEF